MIFWHPPPGLYDPFLSFIIKVAGFLGVWAYLLIAAAGFIGAFLYLRANWHRLIRHLRGRQ